MGSFFKKTLSFKIIESLMLALLIPSSLQAYSCRMKPFERQISESGMIFEGEVVQVDYILVPNCKSRNLHSCPTEKHPGGRGSYITFKIKKSWKGIPEGEYIIRREGSSFIYSRPFKVGENWIIFSNSNINKIKEFQPRIMTACSGTQKSNPDFIKKLDAHFKKK